MKQRLSRRANDEIQTRLPNWPGRRLSVLELAQGLGNVSEACRRRGSSRTTFYEYKKRFAEHGLEGLKDLPPLPKSHLFTTPPEVVERILEIRLSDPARGCNWIRAQLKLEGISVSYSTVQKILNQHGMGTRYDRWIRLEEQAQQAGFELSAEQCKFLEKQNPQWREKHNAVDRGNCSRRTPSMWG